jgi:hypothetical protein
MPSQSFYPKDLSLVLQQRWRDAGHDPDALPAEKDLFQLIDIAYQASLLREEDSRFFVACWFPRPTIQS